MKSFWLLLSCSTGWSAPSTLGREPSSPWARSSRLEPCEDRLMKPRVALMPPLSDWNRAQWIVHFPATKQIGYMEQFE